MSKLSEKFREIERSNPGTPIVTICYEEHGVTGVRVSAKYEGEPAVRFISDAELLEAGPGAVEDLACEAIDAVMAARKLLVG